MARDNPFLMIPGPTQVTADVLSWMGKPLIAHYGNEWVEIFEETVTLVQRVFRTSSEVFMIPGTGTTGLEMATRSCFSVGDRVVVLTNGPFGENLARMASFNGLEVVKAKLEWGDPMTPDWVEKALDGSAAVGIICTHVDTMVGVRNPAQHIGEIARRRGALFILDAVSSLAGEELATDEWGVDLCCSATQKCLGAPPGLALVSVSAKAWQAMENRKDKHKGWYFDFLNWRKVAREWADWHPHPATMPASVVLALRESLKEILEEEGLEQAVQRHKEVASVVRRALGRLGLRVVPDQYAANTVTTAYTPDGIEPEEIQEFIRQRHNIQISRFLGDDVPKAIRVGHMGTAARLTSALPVILGIEEFMRRRGFDVNLGADLLEAAQAKPSAE